MRKHPILTPLVMATALAACSTAPPNNPNIEVARRSFLDASNDRTIAQLAPNELKQAGDALQAADESWLAKDDTTKVDALAYIAKQKLEIAREVSKRRLAEEQLGEASKQREQIVAAQRTAEAQKARRDAEAAQARSRQLEQELRALAAKETERGTIITLGNLMFNAGSTELNPGGVRELQKVAEILQQNPKRTVMIEGFTDSTGSEQLNQHLSEQRSQAIRAALVSMGVSAERIATRGYGEAFPIADNRTAAGRQINRRVEIVISDESGRIAPRVTSARG
jgi:outer membrane protein OmpA-like peptidoglycan-associated protein